MIILLTRSAPASDKQSVTVEMIIVKVKMTYHRSTSSHGACKSMNNRVAHDGNVLIMERGKKKRAIVRCLTVQRVYRYSWKVLADRCEAVLRPSEGMEGYDTWK